MAYEKRLPAARHIGKRGDQRTSYKLLSPKNGAVLYLESNIEALVARALELDTRFRTFEAQPFSIELNTGRIFASKEEGKNFFRGSIPIRDLAFYTPDFRADNRRIIECKPERRLAEMGADIARWRYVITQLGYEFEVITETFFRKDALERNLMRLFQAHVMRSDSLEKEEIDRDLRKHALTRAQWTIGELAQSFGIHPGGVVAPILSGEFRIDLRKRPISTESVLKRKPQPGLEILP